MPVPQDLATRVQARVTELRVAQGRSLRAVFWRTTFLWCWALILAAIMASASLVVGGTPDYVRLGASLVSAAAIWMTTVGMGSTVAITLLSVTAAWVIAGLVLMLSILMLPSEVFLAYAKGDR